MKKLKLTEKRLKKLKSALLIIAVIYAVLSYFIYQSSIDVFYFWIVASAGVFFAALYVVFKTTQLH